MGIFRNPYEIQGSTRGLVGRHQGPWIGKANDRERLSKALIPFSFYTQGVTICIPLANCVSINMEPSSQYKHKSHFWIRRANCAHVRPASAKSQSTKDHGDPVWGQRYLRSRTVFSSQFWISDKPRKIWPGIKLQKRLWMSFLHLEAWSTFTPLSSLNSSLQLGFGLALKEGPQSATS